MKKFFASFIALALFGAASYAQQSSFLLGGGYAGVNVSSVTSYGESSSTDAKPFMGFYGMFSDRILFGNFALTPSLVYSYSTRRVDDSFGTSSITLAEGSMRESEHRIGLSLNAEYGFDIAFGAVRPYFFAGVTPELLLSSKEHYVTSDVLTGEHEWTVDNMGDSPVWRPFDVLAGGGAGVDIINMVRLFGGYRYGLLDIAVSDNVTAHRGGWYVGLQLMF